MSKANVHVQLPNSLAVRKKVLATAIDVTHSLKDYQKYKALVVRRKKKIDNLHTLMKQIKTFGAKVYGHDFGTLSGDLAVKKKSGRKSSKEEDRLSSELRKIERKLKGL